VAKYSIKMAVIFLTSDFTPDSSKPGS